MAKTSTYSSVLYATRDASLKAAGMSAFTYDADIRAGVVETKVSPKLDPLQPNSRGERVRESLDSELFPNSHAVAIFFDVTGSMRKTPKIFQQRLDKLMGTLVKKGYLENPHILFGAIGDATCDTVPVQIGQFEGSNEIDNVLGDIYLEGGGGVGQQESYELPIYYMARHTVLDCLDKRGRKGYMFITGDELPYSTVKASAVKKYFGDVLDPQNPHAEIPLADILAELREKFEVFWIIPSGSSYFEDKKVLEPLKELFGQNLLKLDKPEDIVELIAATIGLAEGYDIASISEDLLDMGSEKESVSRVSTSLAVYSGTAANNKLTVGVVTGDLTISGSDDVDRG